MHSHHWRLSSLAASTPSPEDCPTHLRFIAESKGSDTIPSLFFPASLFPLLTDFSSKNTYCTHFYIFQIQVIYITIKCLTDCLVFHPNLALEDLWNFSQWDRTVLCCTGTPVCPGRYTAVWELMAAFALGKRSGSWVLAFSTPDVFNLCFLQIHLWFHFCFLLICLLSQKTFQLSLIMKTSTFESMHKRLVNPTKLLSPFLLQIALKQQSKLLNILLRSNLIILYGFTFCRNLNMLRFL